VSSRRLEGRTVLIAGAGGGQGTAGAVLFAREGARLALTDIDGQALQRTVDLVDDQVPGTTVFASVVDLRSLAALERFVLEVEERFDGVIDVVYNNAGVNHLQSIEDATEQDWDRVHDINLKSSFFMIKYALPALKRSGSASVVNVSSGAGLLAPADGNSMYCSSKGALISLTRAQARDLAPYGIRVNCLLPGPIETPMVRGFFDAMPEEKRAEAEREVVGRAMFKRFGQPGEVAAVAVFLSLPEASFMTAAVIPVDAGWTAV
jgi:NAD(P)-dependent dehydrogenase (short-subunit alcohol dehydrogenase family)